MAARADGGDGVKLITTGDEAVVHEPKRELMRQVVRTMGSERCAQPIGVDLGKGVAERRIGATDFVLADTHG